MSLETASYISDLNAAFPPDADPVGQADDHLRLIKSVLKTTFPNITGPVTATQSQLNQSVPAGVIAFWFGSTANCPSGWAVCTGQTVARSDGSGNITTPNLIGSFIRCDATSGTTGGALTHAHGLNIAGHALTVAELPAHGHNVIDPGHNHTLNDPGHQHTMGSSNVGTFGSNGPFVNNAGSGTAWTSSLNQTGITMNPVGTGITIGSTGSGSSHAHAGSTSDSQSNLPPFYGLVAIMKV